MELACGFGERDFGLDLMDSFALSSWRQLLVIGSAQINFCCWFTLKQDIAMLDYRPGSSNCSGAPDPQRAQKVAMKFMYIVFTY